jgi:hypothetical protein
MPIGWLETPMIWKDQYVVCMACHQKLSGPTHVILEHRGVHPLAEAIVSRPKGKYKDTLKLVRVICLIVGLLFWPLLLAWVTLGVYHLIQKNRYANNT